MKLADLRTPDQAPQRVPFASVMHAVTWYFAARDRYAAPKSPHSVLEARLDLGTVIQGGVGSVLEKQLCLVADVEKCLPLPSQPYATPATEAWLRWMVFAVGVQNEASMAEIAKTVGNLSGVSVSTLYARRLLSDAIWHVTTRMRERGLVL